MADYPVVDDEDWSRREFESTANLLEYLLPTALDVPDLELDHIESPSIDAVGGFKGVGEAGVTGAVPAIANAVADALAGVGANINRVPLRPSTPQPLGWLSAIIPFPLNVGRTGHISCSASAVTASMLNRAPWPTI